MDRTGVPDGRPRLADSGEERALSVEYAHIPGELRPSDEQAASAAAAARIAARHPSQVHTVVLIDQYHSPNRLYRTPRQLDRFAQDLADVGLRPDGVYWESDLVPAALRLIATITDPRLRARQLSYLDPVKGRGKVTCSALTAAWYLSRLGREEPLTCHMTGLALPPAAKLVNVLPEYFREVEGKVDELLSATPNADAAALITRVWTAHPDRTPDEEAGHTGE
jgi:hypothetical protein